MPGHRKRTNSSINDEIRAIALAQHGMVAYRQLASRGILSGSISNRVKTGFLVPVCPRVYALAGTSLTDKSIWMAGVLASGSGAMLAGTAAAELHGFANWNGIVDVRRRTSVQTHGKRIQLPSGQSRPLLIRRFRKAALREAVSVDGIPAAGPVQTLYDLAEIWGGQARLKWAFIEADRLGLLDESGTDRMIGPNFGFKGAGELRKRARIKIPRLELTDTALEALTLDLLAGTDLPLPEVNKPEGSYRLDFVFVEQRLIIEVDGGSHQGLAKRLDDHERENQLVRGGWSVLRFAWWDMTERPLEVLPLIREALLARGWVPPEGPGN